MPLATDKPVAQFSSLFRSASIPVLPQRNDEDQDWTLGIIRADGDLYEIAFTDAPASSLKVKVDFARVPLGKVATLAGVHSVFHQITECAGYGRPSIVDRGKAPEGKLNYVEHFDLIVMRHCEFRRVPNPSPEVFKSYQRTLNTVTRHFYQTNWEFCMAVGLELDDLMTYAMVWTCNFHGQYELSEDRARNADNQKLLYRHLQQRFTELRRTYRKRAKNVVVDYDTAAVSLYDRPFTPSVDFEAETAAACAESMATEKETELELAAKRKKKAEPEIDPKLRRRQAQRRLTEKMAELPHDALIERLRDAFTNFALAPEVRDEALRQLKKHAKKCETCKGVVILSTQTPRPVRTLSREEIEEAWAGVAASDIVLSIHREESDEGLEEDEEAGPVDADGAAE